MINRRTLIKGASATSLISLFSRTEPAYGATPTFWVHVQGSGGYDQTLFCDPKPDLRASFLTDAATYPNGADLRLAGNIPYLGFADFGRGAAGGFFGKYHDRLLVFNGVDTSTNNHDIGSRYSACGSINPGFPCFTAQVAGVHATALVMPLIHAGGLEEVAGLTSMVRITPESLATFANLFNFNTAASGAKFLPDAVASKVEAASRERLKRLKDASQLADRRAAIDRLLSMRERQGNLSSIVVPPSRSVPAGTALTSGFMREIEFAFNAFRAGHCLSMNISFGGFDTHTDNEIGQKTALKSLLDHLEFIMQQAEDQAGGGANKVRTVVVVSSDFGRTPFRTTTGTDHWPVSSIMVLQSSAVLGNLNLPADKVIGATDAQLKAIKIDPVTFQPSSTGIVLRPGHVYSALRRAAGVAGASVLARFGFGLDRELNLG